MCSIWLPSLFNFVQFKNCFDCRWKVCSKRESHSIRSGKALLPRPVFGGEGVLRLPDFVVAEVRLQARAWFESSFLRRHPAADRSAQDPAQFSSYSSEMILKMFENV